MNRSILLIATLICLSTNLKGQVNATLETYSLPIDSLEMKSIEFSNTGKYIHTYNPRNGTINLWNASTKVLLAKFPSYGNPLRYFDERDQYFIFMENYSSKFQMVKIDIKTLKAVDFLKLSGRLVDGKYLQKGDFLFMKDDGSYDQKRSILLILQKDTFTKVDSIAIDLNEYADFKYKASNNGRVIAINKTLKYVSGVPQIKEGKVDLYQMEDKQFIKQKYVDHKGEVDALFLSKEGKYLITQTELTTKKVRYDERQSGFSNNTASWGSFGGSEEPSEEEKLRKQKAIADFYQSNLFKAIDTSIHGIGNIWDVETGQRLTKFQVIQNDLDLPTNLAADNYLYWRAHNGGILKQRIATGEFSTEKAIESPELLLSAGYALQVKSLGTIDSIFIVNTKSQILFRDQLHEDVTNIEYNDCCNTVVLSPSFLYSTLFTHKDGVRTNTVQIDLETMTTNGSITDAYRRPYEAPPANGKWVPGDEEHQLVKQ